MLASVPAGMAFAQGAPAIDPAALSAHVRTLASDAFEGRAPGTEGERRTIAYLTEQFRAAGAEPGGENGGWTQAVRINRYQIQGTPRVSIRGGSAACTFELGDAAILWTRNPSPRVSLTDAPLVFAGFGVNAPELGWDDYAGQDLTGRVVVLLSNDPDFDAESGPFGGRAMSYYARFSSKIEEAARRGAAAIVLIHGPNAGVQWEISRAVNSAPEFRSCRRGGQQPRFFQLVQRGRGGTAAALRRPRFGRGHTHRATPRLSRASAERSDPLRRVRRSGPAGDHPQCHRPPPGRTSPERDLHLHRALGSYGPRPAGLDRRHDLQWRDGQCGRRRRAAGAGAGLRRRAAAGALDPVHRDDAGGERPARRRILCHATRSIRSRPRSAASTWTR